MYCCGLGWEGIAFQGIDLIEAETNISKGSAGKVAVSEHIQHVVSEIQGYFSHLKFEVLMLSHKKQKIHLPEA